MLGGGQQRRPADGPVGRAGQGTDQPGPSGEEGVHIRAVEQFAAVLHHAGETGGAGPFGEVDGEVHPRGAGADRFGLDLDPGQGEPGLRGVLEGEHDLEQRVVCGAARRVQHFHEVFERDVLVRVRGQARLPDPAEEFGEGGVAGGVGAQHEGVDEVADQFVQRLIRAAGDRHTDRDVGARPQPGEQRRQRGLQHHEHGRAGALGQVQHLTVRLRVQFEPGEVAPVCRPCGPGVGGGQRDQLGQPGEGVRPVVELPGEQAVRVAVGAEQLPLPQGVVRVLHGQRRPVRGQPGAAARVGGDQIAGQRAERPAVSRDVVQQQQQDGFGVLDLEQPGAYGDVRREVEAVPRRFGQRGVQVRTGHGAGAPVEGDGVRVEDHLARFAVGLGQHGAQHFVAGQYVVQGRPERVLVQGAGQPQRERDVVGGARPLQAVQEPQAALRVRQRQHLGAWHRDERRVGLAGPREVLGEPGDGG
ncbi:hypothetical protein GCM10010417_39390 [Streptomyces carpaticus]